MSMSVCNFDPVMSELIRILYEMQHTKSHLLDTESFASTFGPKSHRKRYHTKAGDIKVSG